MLRDCSRFGIGVAAAACGLAFLPTLARAEVYSHELRGTIAYKTASGATQAGTNTENIETTASTVAVNTMYGYIFANLMEPILEVDFVRELTKIGTSEKTNSTVNLGFGVLFNMPVGSAMSQGSAADAKRPPREGDHFVPYGGLLLSRLAVLSSQRDDAEAKTSSAEMVMKVIVGNRYFIAPYVAIDSSIRMFYQNSANEQQSPTSAEKTKSESRQLTIDIRLFGISMLL